MTDLFICFGTAMLALLCVVAAITQPLRPPPEWAATVMLVLVGLAALYAIINAGCVLADYLGWIDGCPWCGAPKP